MTASASVEIACDESGSDGENLMAGSTRVFAHGSTDLAPDEARALVTSLQSATGFAGLELKSPRLLGDANSRKRCNYSSLAVLYTAGSRFRSPTRRTWRCAKSWTW